MKRSNEYFLIQHHTRDEFPSYDIKFIRLFIKTYITKKKKKIVLEYLDLTLVFRL